MKRYRRLDLLTQTKQKLNAKLILMEPFVLPVPEDRKAWREDLADDGSGFFVGDYACYFYIMEQTSIL
jgi:hypothetical protein